MGNRAMSEETKAKIAATREAKKADAGGTNPAQKKASLDDKIAALQAAADAGDHGAMASMGTIDTLKAVADQAKAACKTSQKRLRKVVNALSNL